MLNVELLTLFLAKTLVLLLSVDFSEQMLEDDSESCKMERLKEVFIFKKTYGPH